MLTEHLGKAASLWLAVTLVLLCCSHAAGEDEAVGNIFGQEGVLRSGNEEPRDRTSLLGLGTSWVEDEHAGGAARAGNGRKLLQGSPIQAPGASGPSSGGQSQPATSTPTPATPAKPAATPAPAPTIASTPATTTTIQAPSQAPGTPSSTPVPTGASPAPIAGTQLPVTIPSATTSAPIPSLPSNTPSLTPQSTTASPLLAAPTPSGLPAPAVSTLPPSTQAPTATPTAQGPAPVAVTGAPTLSTAAPAPLDSRPANAVTTTGFAGPVPPESSGFNTTPSSTIPLPITNMSSLVASAPLPVAAQGNQVAISPTPPASTTSFTPGPTQSTPSLTQAFIGASPASQPAPIIAGVPVPSTGPLAVTATSSPQLSGANPACLPSCDPLVVQLKLLNSDLLTFQQGDLINQLSQGLNVSTSQVLLTQLSGAGVPKQLTVTLFILPPQGAMTFDPSTIQAINSTLYAKQVKLDPASFGDYQVLSVQLYSDTLPKPSPTPAPAPVVAPAPAPEATPAAPSPALNSTAKIGGGGSGGGSSLLTILVAVLVGVAALVILLSLLCCWKLRKRHRKEVTQQELYKSGSSVGGSLPLAWKDAPMGPSNLMPRNHPRAATARVFSYEELSEATKNWDINNVLGEGGFGRVYKGLVKDGQAVAVKKLTLGGHQGDREFAVEVEMLSRLHHRHLVKLIGYYSRPEVQLLCYELVPNGSLEQHLHGTKPFRSSRSQSSLSPRGTNESPRSHNGTPRGGSLAVANHRFVRLHLDWDARMKIAIGAARGLAYLHEDCQPCVIHRDFKASNILLEENFHAKVADFGLAKQAPDGNSKDYLSTRVMGTFGYVAPEYAMTGHLLVKSDVYSYGVVLLELITGRKPVDMRAPPGQENLVTWARPLLTNRDRMHELADPRLESQFPLEDMVKVAAIAAMCVQAEPVHRPNMGEVVQKLRALQRGGESQYSGDSNALSEAARQTLGTTYPSKEQPYPWANGQSLQSAMGTPNYQQYESETSQQFDSQFFASREMRSVTSYDSEPQQVLSPRLASERYGGRPPAYPSRSSYDSEMPSWRANGYPGSDQGNLSRSTIMSLAPQEGR